MRRLLLEDLFWKNNVLEIESIGPLQQQVRFCGNMGHGPKVRGQKLGVHAIKDGIMPLVLPPGYSPACFV